MNQPTIDNFMQDYFQEGLLGQISWLGMSIWKTPADLWVYQELLHEVQPSAVIELGTYEGGTACYLATVLEAIGLPARVLSVDIADSPNKGGHPRVDYLIGNTVTPVTVDYVKSWIGRATPVLIIVDSNHQAAHVSQELELYGPLVTSGSYLIVEDTHINHPWIVLGIERGPAEALAEWLPKHPEYTVDNHRTRFGMTVCRGGFLRKA